MARPATTCRREEQGQHRRDPRFLNIFLLVFAAVALVVGIVPDHQHVLDPGRPAQPRARAAARDGRVAPAGHPLGAARGVRRRADRLDDRARSSATCCARAPARCSACSGSTCPAPTSRSSRARSSSATSSGIVVTMFAAYLPARRASQDRPGRGDARRRRAARVGAAQAAARSASSSPCSGQARIAAGLRRRGWAGCARWSGSGLLAILVGVSLMSPVIGAPVIRGSRLLLPRALRDRRAARAGELAAQPTPDRGDRQRADDRPGPGGDDVDPRRLGEGQHRQAISGCRHLPVRGLATRSDSRSRPTIAKEIRADRRVSTPSRSSARRTPKIDGVARVPRRRRPEPARARPRRRHHVRARCSASTAPSLVDAGRPRTRAARSATRSRSSSRTASRR